MNTKQLAYLDAMDISVWQKRNMQSKPITMDIQTISPTAEGIWEKLELQVKNCTLCELSKTRTQTVFGVGNRQTDLLLIGEAPGASEDAQGEPFVGRAGLLLNEMLKSIGLNRQTTYITNILKCRPPNNRDPLPHEVKLCTPYLNEQITLINPKMIVAIGRIAAQFLLNTDTPIGKMRTQLHHYGEKKIPLIVIYHPAYLLRSPREKAKAYRDMLQIQKILKSL
ncbi:MAG: uracil-DNA glycosylase [Pseudomonadota bacterium]